MKNKNIQHLFSLVPSVKIPRSAFDRSHGLKTSVDEGYLYPILCEEVLPGDTFHLNTTIFGRMTTPIKPIMDNIQLRTEYFFVPLRLVWDNFKRFMGEQDNPGDSTSYLIPTMTSPASTGYANSSIFDYFGLRPGIPGFEHSSLPLRCYNLIWNNWYRDQNLQNSVTVLKGDTSDPAATYTLLKRNKTHDYFTSALPWPQKGTAISIPLGSTAPVYGNGKALGLTDGTTSRGLASSSATFGTMVHATNAYNTNIGTASTTSIAPNSTVSLGVVTSGVSGLVADLSNAYAATINSLRQAFQLQRMMERDARGGTRYIELIQSHFGVISPDARMQRPEYLGGGKAFVNINPIAQTSSTDATTPQANLSAMGTVHSPSSGFSKSFTEHGYVIGLASFTADLTYQQGLHRHWTRSTKNDFYWPSLSMIGEQIIRNDEIYVQGTAADDAAFGYQERYAEYRYAPSRITGKLRSDYATSLDIWHLGQKFLSLPALNDSFLQEAPPISRVVAVPSEPHFLLDIYFKFRAIRPMPVYGVPGMIDRF